MIQAADIHCHIIPYVDDGALRVQESEELVEMLAAQGVRTVCCTPHLRRHMFETPDEEIRLQFERLLARSQNLDVPMQFYLSREYHCDELLRKKLDAGEILPLGRGNVLLAEFSYRHPAEDILNYIRLIRSYGYQPLIAHAERYAATENLAQAARFIEAGALIQMNASSLLGAEGRRQASLCRKLLKEDLVHVIASDAHDPSDRPPEIDKCAAYLERKFGTETAKRLLHTNPLQILNVSDGGSEHADS